MSNAPETARGSTAVRIAVASRDGRSIAGHIGKCADWIVFEVTLPSDLEAEPEVQEVARVSLPKELVFHHYRDDRPHPLQACEVVIGGSAGDSFVERMHRRGIEVVLTAESDPATAVADYIHQTVAPTRPRPIGGLICKLRDALSSEG